MTAIESPALSEAADEQTFLKTTLTEPVWASALDTAKQGFLA